MQKVKSGISVKDTVKHFVIIALAVIFIGASCDKKTFVTQKPYPDMMCGAYSLAFYKWLKSGKTYSENEAADRAEVVTIYNQVMFGTSYSRVDVTSMGVQNFSAANNPVKMLDYAVEVLGKSTAKFYYDSNNPALVSIKNSIEANDVTLMTKHSDRIFAVGIPALNVGQYALVLFRVGKGASLHWVVCHNNGNGLVFYDPYFGEARPITDAQMRGSSTLQVTYSILQSLNSCLFLE
jgi:hypothetical protein